MLKILVQLQGVIARSLYLRRFTNAQVYSVVPTLRIAFLAYLSNLLQSHHVYKKDLRKIDCPKDIDVDQTTSVNYELRLTYRTKADGLDIFLISLLTRNGLVTSDAILDAHLEQDPDAKVACETVTKTGMVMVSYVIRKEQTFRFSMLIQGNVYKKRCNF